MPATTFAWRPVAMPGNWMSGPTRCRFLYLLTTGLAGKLVVFANKNGRLPGSLR